ncbi:hypothetical protein C8Q80DRAFT_839699 [Daedaleopsis nitida]|nr:hypothetical protein C8Q80DRAFT_839699 [Daedaleopsis nitida]
MSTEMSTANGSGSAPVQAHRDYIRCRLLHEHIHRSLRQKPSNKNISQSLVLSAALHSISSDPQHDDESIFLPGGLTPADVGALTPAPPLKLGAHFCGRLEAELEHTLLSVSDHLSTPDEPHNDGDRVEVALQRFEQVTRRKERLSQQEAALEEARARVIQLVEKINQAQHTLESKLVDTLTTLPPHLQATRVAQADVVAATIETALLKLSLVRTLAYAALYGHEHPQKPDATVAQAVRAAHEKLRDRQRAQEDEMQRLDRQIEEYEGMLQLVDGRDGSFAQVVKDMARVKRETDECRKDLRRLGWTGD